jgi:hypothetical protein
LNISLRPNGEVLVTLNSDKSEFEDHSEFISFAPRIDQMKYAVIRPNSGSDFFVDADPLRIALTRLKPLCSFVEFAVLR